MKYRVTPASSILLFLCIVGSSLAFWPMRASASAANTAPVDPTLIAYWKMDEGTGSTVVDSAGNDHDLFLTSSPSTPQWSTDVPPLASGNAHSLAFDGVDDYAYAYPLPETAGGSQLTVEAWVKFDGSTVLPYQSLVTANEPHNGHWTWGTADTNNSPLPNELQVFVPTGNNYWGYTVGANLQPNQWYHLAFVFDGNGATAAERLKVYVNGAAYPMNFSDMPANLTFALPTVRLGFGRFHGKFDEVCIYTVARSATDIAADASGQTAPTQPPPPPDPAPAPVPGDPVVYWKMEEGGGPTVVDSAGNGHDLFLTSSPSTPQWSTDAPPLAGDNNYSLAFDGVNDYAYAYPLPETSGGSQLTVEAWVKFDGSTVQPYQGLVMANEPHNGHWTWGTADSNNSPLPNELQVFVPTGNNYWGYTVGANLQPNQWYHVAFVFDGSEATAAERLKVYVNGAAYPMNFSDMPAILTYALPTPRLGFGRFRGKLDEVRIYTVARSSTDILNDAQGLTAPTQPPPPIPPPPAPVPGDPVFYWRMEEGTGTTVMDSAGNGHDLFLTSSPSTPQWSTDVPALVGGNNYSLAFDGMDDYAYAYPLPETAGGSHLTVEAWVKFDSSSVPPYKGLVTANEPAGNEQWTFGTADSNNSPLPNELQVFVPTGNNYWGYTVGANLQPNQWYHLAFVFDGNGATAAERLKVYVNGVAYPMNFSGMPSTLANTLPTLRLGTGGFHGKMDEVCIYTVARSSADIANDAGGQTCASSNIIPIVTVENASVAVDEGGVATNTGDYSDVNAGDTVLISASIGTVTKTGTNSGTWSWSFSTTDGPAQSQTVTITSDDGHGGVATTSFALTVNNVAPSVNVPTLSSEPSNKGASVTVSATFSDSSENDSPFTCTLNYGDDSGVIPGAVADNTCVGSAHMYTNIGTYVVTVSVTDKDNSTGSKSAIHRVIYAFNGFFQPVDNPPVLNVIKAGRGAAVKFSLSGNQGLNIFATGYPKSQQIACNTGAPLDNIEETITVGSSGLSYDPLTDQYNYHWKTNTTWAGTCRQLILRLNDGTDHIANFKFK